MFIFNVESKDKIIDVTLKGRLDATAAPDLFKEMEKHQGEDVNKIVFHVEELEYIASAGLRVIIFTKQKIGEKADVVMKGANEMVKSVLEMTGCDSFVTLI